MTRHTLPQQHARETKRRILDAAGAVLAKDGWAEPTVEDIASEAGVSIGAFYHHFPSKTDLLKAILEEHLGGAIVEFRQILPAPSLHEMIERFADAWIQHLTTTPGFNRLFHELAGADEAWATEAVARFHSEATEQIGSVLLLAQRFRLVRQDLDPAAAAAVILAMMQGIESLWSTGDEFVRSPAFRSAWVSAVQRYIAADGPGDLERFQQEAARLFFADDDIEGG